MRILDTTAISNSVGFPFKSGTFTHLQTAYKETIAEAVKASIGTGYDATKIYVLSGLVNSGSGDNYIISAGSIFYNDEIYIVPTATFTATAPNVAVLNIVISYFSAVNADAVTFTDGTPRNVHQIRQAIASAGLSGSGIANYADRRKAVPRLPFSKNPEMYLGSFADFDASGIGIVPDTMGYALCDGQGGRYDMRGLFIVGAKQGDANFPAVGNTGGSKTVNSAHTHSVPRDGWGTTTNRGVSGGLLAGPNDGGASWAGNDNVTGTGGNAALPILPPYFSVLYVVRIY